MNRVWLPLILFLLGPIMALIIGIFGGVEFGTESALWLAFAGFVFGFSTGGCLAITHYIEGKFQ